METNAVVTCHKVVPRLRALTSDWRSIPKHAKPILHGSRPSITAANVTLMVGVKAIYLKASSCHDTLLLQAVTLTMNDPNKSRMKVGYVIAPMTMMAFKT